jgi:hypothetical protein
MRFVGLVVVLLALVAAAPSQCEKMRGVLWTLFEATGGYNWRHDCTLEGDQDDTSFCWFQSVNASSPAFNPCRWAGVSCRIVTGAPLYDCNRTTIQILGFTQGTGLVGTLPQLDFESLRMRDDRGRLGPGLESITISQEPSLRGSVAALLGKTKKFFFMLFV